MPTIEEEFAEIVKNRKEVADEKANLFTTLVIVVILLPLWLLAGHKW